MITKDEYVKFALAYKQRAWQYWMINKPQHAFINTKMQIISLMKAEILTTSHSHEIETTLGFEDVVQLVKSFKTSCVMSGRKVDAYLLQRFLDIGNSWKYDPDQYKSLCLLACQLLRTSCINENTQVNMHRYSYDTENYVLQYIEKHTSHYIAKVMRKNKYGDILSVLDQIAIDNSDDCESRLNVLLGVR